MSSWIHWHEGLFLQPHHLQRFQRGLQESMGIERSLSWAYPYGLIEAKISEDDLANRRIRFERLKAVMPSGTLVEFPDHAELPAIDLKQALSRHKTGFQVLLGVPPWDDIRANVAGEQGAAGSGARLHYVVTEKSCRDENTGENPRPVPYRKVNAFLVLEDDDLTNLETMPLLRILPGVGKEDAFCRQDPDYAPPCLIMKGSPTLRNMVYDLTSRIQASRDRLVVQINQGGFNIELLRGLQLEAPAPASHAQPLRSAPSPVGGGRRRQPLQPLSRTAQHAGGIERPCGP
jgi:type VI secretion system protein ImpJ